MSELGNALGGSGSKHPLTIGGKTYHVGLVTQAIKLAYERALYARAREGLAALRGDLDGDMYAEGMFKLSEKYEDGEFALEGERGKKTLKSPHGVTLILSLLMGVDQQEVLQCLLTDETQVQNVFRSVMRESFPSAAWDVKPAEGEAASGGQSLPKAPSEPTPAPSG